VKIRQTVERDCCEPQDIKPYRGETESHSSVTYGFCTHCGQPHRHAWYTDAAGSRDWRWEKVKLP